MCELRDDHALAGASARRRPGASSGCVGKLYTIRELDRHAKSVIQTSPNVLNLKRKVIVRLLRDDSSGVGDSAPCGLSGSAHCVPKSGTIRQLDRRIERLVYSFVRLLSVREISVCLSFVTKRRVVVGSQRAGSDAARIASRRRVL